MLAVCIVFTVTDINLAHTATSQNIDHWRALGHTDKSFLVQNSSRDRIIIPNRMTSSSKFKAHYCACATDDVILDIQKGFLGLLGDSGS